MPRILHSNIYALVDYSKHLKSLTQEDKSSRFGHAVSDHAIDQLILRMVYNPDDHEIFTADVDGKFVGWGHLAKTDNDSWELAVSVEKEYQRQGIGNKLIQEMLVFAKFHKIEQIYMHCISSNHAIQNLASKNKLTTRERGFGERTAAIELSKLNIFETNEQLMKEQAEVLSQIATLRLKLADIWANALPY
jgi:RimJ/RimL family protein N-acetyltransferase